MLDRTGGTGSGYVAIGVTVDLRAPPNPERRTPNPERRTLKAEPRTPNVHTPLHLARKVAILPNKAHCTAESAGAS
jgi:hypothetical protein